MGRNSVWAQVSVCMFNLVLFSDLDLFRKYHRGKRVRKAGAVDTIGEVSNEEAEDKVGLLLIEAKAKMS